MNLKGILKGIVGEKFFWKTHWQNANIEIKLPENTFINTTICTIELTLLQMNINF